MNKIILLLFVFSNFYLFSNDNLLFTSRKKHTVVSFKDKMWVISGEYGNLLEKPMSYNDIWMSNNGTNWVICAKNVFKPIRVDFSCIIFKDKIWIIGGYNHEALTYLNDVWSSSDGIKWKREVSNASFGVRANASLVEYQNKLWLIGGVKTFGTNLNDVWTSTNGLEWKLVTDKLQTNLSDHKVFTINEKLILLSSSTGVFSSKDGISWQKLTDAKNIINRHSFSAVKMNDQIFIIGGENLSKTGFYNNLLSDVWSTKDGKVWVKISPYPPGILSDTNPYFSFRPSRKHHSTVVFKNKIYILGGVINQGKTYLNDIWSSPDGARWVKIR